MPPKVRFLWLKCTKIDFGWGSATNPAGGAYSTPPHRLAGFKGPTSLGKGWEGSGREVMGTGKKGQGTEWKEKGGVEWNGRQKTGEGKEREGRRRGKRRGGKG